MGVFELCHQKFGLSFGKKTLKAKLEYELIYQFSMNIKFSEFIWTFPLPMCGSRDYVLPSFQRCWLTNEFWQAAIKLELPWRVITRRRSFANKIRKIVVQKANARINGNAILRSPFGTNFLQIDLTHNSILPAPLMSFYRPWRDSGDFFSHLARVTSIIARPDVLLPKLGVFLVWGCTYIPFAWYNIVLITIISNACTVNACN